MYYSIPYAVGNLVTDPHLHKQQEMSNNTVQCNETQNQYRITSLTVGMIGIVGVILCGLILASLLLILKKKAWESPVKRLGLALTISTALSSLTYAAINLSTPSPAGLCRVNVFFEACWGTSTLLYFNTLLFALLLQVSAPIIPERWKHTQRYIPKALYTEIILHTSVFILTLLISIVTISAVQNCCDVNVIFYEVFVLISLALSALILVFTILIFGLFFRKFHRIRVVTTTTKRAVIKLSVVFMMVVVVFLFITIPSGIERKLRYQNIIVVDIIFDPTVIELVLLLPLITVIYLPSTQCCKCHKRTPRQLPLLPNTEMHTNPPSEWDHSNIPSITVSVHPNEMSDCETDHVSSLTVPGPKYGTTI